MDVDSATVSLTASAWGDLGSMDRATFRAARRAVEALRAQVEGASASQVGVGSVATIDGFDIAYSLEQGIISITGIRPARGS